MYEKFIFCNLKFFPPFSPNESIYFVPCKKCCESIYFVLYLMRKDCVITHILLQMNLYIRIGEFHRPFKTPPRI